MAKTLGQKLKAKGAQISTMAMPGNTLPAQHAKDLIKRAAECLKPISTDEYIGSAIVHFYKSGNDTHFLSQVVGCDELHEVQASIGFQSLQNKLMAFFGRWTPKDL